MTAPTAGLPDLDGLFDEIRRRGCQTVGLQYPDGMRLRAVEVAEAVEAATGVTVLVAAQPTFGACDVPRMPVDLLVQIGHAPMPYLRMRDVYFLEAPMALPGVDFLEAALPHLGARVGLLTTVQHRAWLDALRDYLEARGKEVVVGGADGRTAYPAQLLGCDVHPARAVEDAVDGFLYVGTGDFHPLGVALASAKPVVVADPFTEEVRTLDGLKDRILRQRHAAIARAQEAERFGVIVSQKVGQYRMALARRAKELLEAHGRRAVLLVMDVVSPDLLTGYRVDAFVNTACPRIAIDDQARYDRPMLTFPELEVVLGLREWGDYRFDEITAEPTAEGGV